VKLGRRPCGQQRARDLREPLGGRAIGDVGGLVRPEFIAATFFTPMLVWRNFRKSERSLLLSPTKRMKSSGAAHACESMDCSAANNPSAFSQPDGRT
jgi:hypothetical protein